MLQTSSKSRNAADVPMTTKNVPTAVDTAETKPKTTVSTVKDADQALDFLSSSTLTNDTIDRRSLEALRRRVDWHIIPYFYLCYTMSFIDKVILNYSAVMGLNKDLHLTGNQFSNTGTLFFVVLLVFEIPNGIILNKIPPAKWFGLSVALWGVATACSAAATDYATLLTARIFLAIFEASMAPCLMILVSQWYTKSEQATRFSIFYTGLGTGQIIGGIVSFAFQHVKDSSFGSWRIMFVTLGCVTVVIGIATFWFVPDNPMQATFLSEEEKVALLHHVSVNQTGVRNHHFKFAQVLELLSDPQIWLLVLLVTLVCIPSGVISLYSSTLLRNFGYSPPIAALLNSPSGIVSIIASIVGGFGVRHTSNRWLWVIGLIVPAFIGTALMLFASQRSQGQLLAGIYLINVSTATLPISYQWVAANVAGHTKRPFAMGLISAAFALANIIGPQTFQAKDAPYYKPARVTIFATQSAAALMSILVYLYYRVVNARRDLKNGVKQEDLSVEEKWGNLTDKENPSFRYVY